MRRRRGGKRPQRAQIAVVARRSTNGSNRPQTRPSSIGSAASLWFARFRLVDAAQAFPVLFCRATSIEGWARATGNSLRRQRRRKHRLPGLGRGTARPRVRDGMGLEHRGVLGRTNAGALPDATRFVFTPYSVRQARHGSFRSVTDMPSLEVRMDDVRAVMDAVASERAALFGVSEGGPMCALFSATYPSRVSALIMHGGFPRRIRTPDFPWGPTKKSARRGSSRCDANGAEPSASPRARRAWSGTNDFRCGGAGCSEWAQSAAVMALVAMNDEIDIRHILPAIRVPTLLLHSVRDATIPIGASRYMAERIPGARLVELPGVDHLPWLSDADAILGEIEEFLTGVRHAVEPDRVLATVLFTDIVGATEKAAALGDRRGGIFSMATTEWFAANSLDFVVARSRQPAMGFSPPSTVPLGLSAALARCHRGCIRWDSRSALAFTLESAKSWATIWVGSRSISALASRRWRRLGRCWCQARSRTWSPAQA